MTPSLFRRFTAEFIGTAFLLMAVVGSGIMAQRMCHDEGTMLLANAIATGGALVALIITFGSISGAHFNPIVTLCMLLQKRIRMSDASVYILAQVCGALLGVAIAHWMFGMPTFTQSMHERSGAGVLLGEGIATFGLIGVVMAVGQRAPSHAPYPLAMHAPYAVAGYIVAGYWFTSSTSFANPAVTLARSLTDSFTGIRPDDAPLFVVAQVLSALVATLLFTWLLREKVEAS